MMSRRNHYELEDVGKVISWRSGTIDEAVRQIPSQDSKTDSRRVGKDIRQRSYLGRLRPLFRALRC